jgi:hypothetical protein
MQQIGEKALLGKLPGIMRPAAKDVVASIGGQEHVLAEEPEGYGYDIQERSRVEAVKRCLQLLPGQRPETVRKMKFLSGGVHPI